MQSHVVRTREMIEQMGFSGEYVNVSSWAGGHHELLDGSGYPLGLKGEEILWETSGQGKLDGELLKSFYESNAWKA